MHVGLTTREGWLLVVALDAAALGVVLTVAGVDRLFVLYRYARAARQALPVTCVTSARRKEAR